MDLGIAGRRALITAASSGLGLGAARALAREGCEVTLVARDLDRLNTAANALKKETGRRPHVRVTDLTDGEAVDLLVEQVRDDESIDILVTNTGGPPAKRFLECTLDDWTAAVDQLLLAPVRLIQGFLPDMIDRGWGRIVCITSTAAREPMDNLLLSNSLRAAVTGMAKTLSREVAAHGVRVNVAAPGLHATPAIDRLIRKRVEQGLDPDPESALAAMRSGLPVGQLGDPDAFGRVVAFLASDVVDQLTGVSLPVDGGRSRGSF
jgi:3-oxoacyl-[acyl-carrier protein] reductase